MSKIFDKSDIPIDMDDDELLDYVSNPFCQLEDTLLIYLVSKHGVDSWSVVARELGNGRTSHQCFDRYVYFLVPALLNELGNMTPIEYLNVSTFFSFSSFLSDIVEVFLDYDFPYPNMKAITMYGNTLVFSDEEYEYEEEEEEELCEDETGFKEDDKVEERPRAHIRRWNDFTFDPVPGIDPEIAAAAKIFQEYILSKKA